ncbi:YVC1 [[Candida] subhashii]|uniref:YVC1 n=1 Tax=[Candida] subhashii TaxID=561895 RepID=A0A8J5UU64_9ASCO|nr:YVC1 [[Candida] subhashii]KAG7661430.1 YVC1 [[Candida] subhashii]
MEPDLEENTRLLSPDPQNPEDEGYFNARFCPNSRQTFRICLNLKTLIDKIVPIIFPESEITCQNSPILNRNVIDLVYKAAGGKGNGERGTSSHKYRAALVFCLLRVCGWYWQQSIDELTDNELYKLRATTAQRLAVIIIERETEDDQYLFLGMLCHRYSICLLGIDADPVSALELAVDMHSTMVIGASGYQRCIKWLWRGWIVQSDTDPHAYIMYKDVASNSIGAHFDPARIKTPYYQNILEIFFNLLYLGLFSIILNESREEVVAPDFIEILFYLFTLGSVSDEIMKFYHVGWYYFSFWSALNDTMYSIISIAVFFRFYSLNFDSPEKRQNYHEISFRLLSCAAPLMWSRLLLYLDAQQFVGAMIVVLKTMMKESILFFVLLFVVIIGFLQGFLGLDIADGSNDATRRILISLIKAVVGDSSLDDMGNLMPPYASILYYIYSFLLSVILMNILIALYSTAYAAIVENATDEYFALVAQKTLRYIRAPDQDLYVPPLNLIEIVIGTFGWMLPRRLYKKLNYYVMLIIYSPLLIYITTDELSNARRIQYNRYKGVPDDANENDTEWDLTDGYDTTDITGSTWEGICERNAEIRDELRNQREGEQQDPEFLIDIKEFRGLIDEVVKPVEDAHKAGIKWEYYELYQKIDKLTELVQILVKENQELKQNPRSKKVLAKDFKISYRKLLSRLSGIPSVYESREDQRRLTLEEEYMLSNWIMNEYLNDRPVDTKRIEEVAVKFLHSRNDDTPLGKKWFERYTDRHPDIELVKLGEIPKGINEGSNLNSVSINSSEKGISWLKKIFEKETTNNPSNDSDEWRLLILDGQSLDIVSDEFMIQCYQHKIWLLYLPPHSCHLTQPLDICLQLTRQLSDAEIEDILRSSTRSFTDSEKRQIVAAYSNRRSEVFGKDNLLQSWKKTGLVPYNPQEVLSRSEVTKPESPGTATSRDVMYMPPQRKQNDVKLAMDAIARSDDPLKTIEEILKSQHEKARELDERKTMLEKELKEVKCRLKYLQGDYDDEEMELLEEPKPKKTRLRDSNIVFSKKVGKFGGNMSR